MTEVIRAYLDRRPFVPFRVTLGGKVPSPHDITDPGLAELTPSVLRLYRADPAAPGGRQMTAMLSLQHVAIVEEIGTDQPFVVTGPGT